jgi:hypothetical protein
MEKTYINNKLRGIYLRWTSGMTATSGRRLVIVGSGLAPYDGVVIAVPGAGGSSGSGSADGT